MGSCSGRLCRRLQQPECLRALPQLGRGSEWRRRSGVLITGFSTTTVLPGTSTSFTTSLMTSTGFSTSTVVTTCFSNLHHLLNGYLFDHLLGHDLLNGYLSNRLGGAGQRNQDHRQGDQYRCATQSPHVHPPFSRSALVGHEPQGLQTATRFVKSSGTASSATDA